MKNDLAFIESQPWLFRFARHWNLVGRRGGVYLLKRLRALGLLDACSYFRINESEKIFVPLYWSYVWGHESLEGYEREAIELFVALVERLGRNVVLIDCGADVGIFSRLVVSRAKSVQKIVAFEPNPVSAAVLKRNLEPLSLDKEVFECAVSNFSGFGRLQKSERWGEYDTHAWFVQPDDRGDISVRTIDGLSLPPECALALKVDVEGGELGVLEGAQNTIKAAPSFVIQLEAHPEVAARTAVDPVEYVRFVCALRDCVCVVSEERNQPIELDVGFFEQFGKDRIYNIILYTPSEGDI